nr:histone lysine N methyltransferase SETMAR [Hymenolepis microstoma]
MVPTFKAVSGDFAVKDRHSGGRMEKFVEDAELEGSIAFYFNMKKSVDWLRLTGLSQILMVKQQLVTTSQEWSNSRKIIRTIKPPHAAKVVEKYPKALKWEILPHPPYSPDVVPSADFYLTHLAQWPTA